MPSDYADWGGLAALQSFINSLNLATQTEQATAAQIATAIGGIGLAVSANQATAAQIATAVNGLGLATSSLQVSAAQIATELATGGIPLLGNPVQQYSVAGPVTVPAHPGTYSPPDVNSHFFSPMSGFLSYDLSFGLQSNAGSAAPFCEVLLSWYADNAGANLLYREVWVAGVASNAPTTVYGTGPVRGAFLSITLVNQDAVNTMTLTNLVVFGNSRPAPEANADWRTSVSGQTIPGFITPSAGANFDGIIGQWTTTVAVSTTVTLLGGLFNGAAEVTYNVSGTSVNATSTVMAFVAGNVLQPVAPFLGWASVLSASQQVQLPRSPIAIRLVNASAVNSVTFAISAIAAT